MKRSEIDMVIKLEGLVKDYRHAFDRNDLQKRQIDEYSSLVASCIGLIGDMRVKLSSNDNEIARLREQLQAFPFFR